MKADERLTSGVAEQRANAGWLRLVSGIGAFVIVVVVGSAAISSVRYTKDLRETRDQVKVLNKELEHRVAARTADLAQARDRAEVLLSEINHRVANSLALVSSLVHLQSKALNDPAAKDALAETQERVFAISLVHKQLYSSTDARAVALDEYFNPLIDHIRTSLRGQGHGLTLACEIERVMLETDFRASIWAWCLPNSSQTPLSMPIPMGLEKSASASEALPDDEAELVVEDDGIGRADGVPAKGTGVGSRIVSAMCASLGARDRLSKPSAWYRCPFKVFVQSTALCRGIDDRDKEVGRLGRWHRSVANRLSAWCEPRSRNCHGVQAETRLPVGVRRQLRTLYIRDRHDTRPFFGAGARWCAGHHEANYIRPCLQRQCAGMQPTFGSQKSADFRSGERARIVCRG